MDYLSDGEEEGWTDVFETAPPTSLPRQEPHISPSHPPSQHKMALMGALRSLAKSTTQRATGREESHPLNDLPLLTISSLEDLSRLEEYDAMAQRYRKICEKQCTDDFLTSMIFPIPDGMFYRYGQLNHILKLILFANDQIPHAASQGIDDGARLADKDLELLAIICLPDWWVEVGEKGPAWWRNIRQDGAVPMANALLQAWDAYRTSGPEIECVTLPFPCPFKKMSEDGLVLWAICFVTTVKDWYFGRDPGGKPSILDPVMQELLFFRGNIRGAPDPIAAMLDNAVCNGKVGQKGFIVPVSHVYRNYHMIIDVSPPPRPEDMALNTMP